MTLDKGGWADVTELIDLTKRHGREISLELIREVVATNNKKRFAFNDDGTRIRANQGHSVDIELGLSPVVPPEVLYHGTATRFLESIKQKGLISATRRHVHLSADVNTAIDVGHRHGKPVVLKIRSLEMHEAGHNFYFSENGVWLVLEVPIKFINFEKL